MARPKSQGTETITFRLPQGTKDRLTAAALTYEDLDLPSDVNVSDLIRTILDEWLDQYEPLQGGAEALAVRLNQARIKEADELLARLRE